MTADVGKAMRLKRVIDGDGVSVICALDHGMTSPTFLDPLADKLLLVALFLTAAWINLLPWWLTAVVVARDVMIGLGAVIYRFWFGPLHGRPTLLSKINTGMQLAVALAAILGGATDLPTPEMVTALAIVTLGTTVVSGADYLSAFTRRALAT